MPGRTVVRAALLVTGLVAHGAMAYPPAVGILSKARSCMACHVSNGPWADEEKTVIDILDAATKTSLKGPDGVFRIGGVRAHPPA